MDWTLSAALPFVALAAGGAVLPVGLARRLPDRRAAVAAAGAASAALLVLAGAILFAVLYRLEGLPGGALDAPAWRHFLSLGLAAGLGWGPVLLLTLLVLAQGVERRRGERIARRRPGPSPGDHGA